MWTVSASADEDEFTRSLTCFAMAYAKQTREDHRLFVDACRGGEFFGVQRTSAGRCTGSTATG
jgi:hypothetical protein